jgi:gas vesicle protein
MSLNIKKHPLDDLPTHSGVKPYLSGLLTGLVAGVVTGLLLAPRSGKELRKQIAGSVGDQTRDLQNQWDKTKSQARETVSNIKVNVGMKEDELSRYADRATKEAREADEEADKALKEADRLADEAKSAMNKVKNTGKLG